MTGKFWLYKWLDEYEVMSFEQAESLLRPRSRTVGPSSLTYCCRPRGPGFLHMRATALRGSLMWDRSLWRPGLL